MTQETKESIRNHARKEMFSFINWIGTAHPKQFKKFMLEYLDYCEKHKVKQ